MEPSTSGVDRGGEEEEREEENNTVKEGVTHRMTVLSAFKDERERES